MKIKSDKEQAYQDFVERNSKDAYSHGVVTYLQRWADLMENRMESGEKIPDMARETSDEADTEGITGFMYGCAVSALSSYWEYGEELRKWHNGKYGYDGEGTVNPAILTIG